jgi:hypothetical protein
MPGQKASVAQFPVDDRFSPAGNLDSEFHGRTKKKAFFGRDLPLVAGERTKNLWAAEPVRERVLMRQLGRVDLLILDDWGPEPLLAEQQRDLLEIVEDRYNAGSLIITSQLPVDRWYELVGNPTLADAILDRLVHNAYRVELSGESLRKPRAST